MKSFIRSAVALAAAALFAVSGASSALAAPLPYINTPLDTVQATVNAAIASINTRMPTAAPLVTASGTTTATAEGLRVTVSVTGLTTAAAGASSAAMVVTNASVAVASQVLCSVNGYAGGGVPLATKIIPAAGSFSFTITNVAASGALDATVPVACIVIN